MIEMKRSWLVQRLEKPRNWTGIFKGKDNPFSFGGGLKNGGLSPEAMDLLRDIWSFDYMGAAEFEFGAVPEALNRVVNFKQLETFSFTVPLKKVPAPFDTAKGKKLPAPEGEAEIFVIARPEWHDEVVKRITGWAIQPYGVNTTQLKESTRLSDALRPSDRYPVETCGWLELDNGFLFFTDREMWVKVCTLFGIPGYEVPEMK